MCSAVQYVGTTNPTVLPIRKMPLVLVYDPLDNHEIAFGVVHFALRRFPRWCAQRWGRYCPPLHEARWRHFVASPLRQSRFFRRKIVHPSAYASAWLGSEYLPSSPAPASTPVCTTPPLSTSPAPRLMLRVRPRYSSIRSLLRIGASLVACTDCVQHLPVRPCLALSQLFAQSESSRLSLHIRRAERGPKARKMLGVCGEGAVLSTCRYVGSTDPTVRPIRNTLDV